MIWISQSHTPNLQWSGIKIGGGAKTPPTIHLENGKALRIAREFFEEAKSSVAMNLSTPRDELVEEETSILIDEPKIVYDHDELWEWRSGLTWRRNF